MKLPKPSRISKNCQSRWLYVQSAAFLFNQKAFLIDHFSMVNCHLKVSFKAIVQNNK
jgi:hypothetical protein